MNLNDIQMLNKTLQIHSMVGSGNTKVYAKDTVSLDSGDNFVEIMKTNINIINKEIKTSYNKVLAKSDMCINIVYLTEDNRINEVKWKIPVMGFIDMQNISDENVCNVNYEVKNVLLKPNNVEEHSIFVEVELEVFCNVYEKKQLDIIQDLYSPYEKLNINQKNITVMQDKKKCKEKCIIKEKLLIPELNNNKICSSEVYAKSIKENVYNDRIMLEGELQVDFMYISNVTNRVDTKSEVIPFNTNIECAGVSNNSNVNVIIEVLAQDFIIMPDNSIEANIELEVSVDVSKMMEVRVIDNLEVCEKDDENIYSIVVYFVKPGDTLWNIAKRFRSTITAISSVNGIENEDKISIGQQLFIPKFV